ncbi:protein YgfX [Grimontia sp. NTOU-MAR1]|uniref:protein YgfX n=1 Tax=Grimontia sp. NTOU-MAR1 TaxID=3111011 RepID=UPI002DBE0EEB|nr:protein YgfX [Grimontia sp. NTOU-MAR1]WRV97152.1 protein YgfX [Grimontia sp. NTOU-MAR1]
MSTTVANSVNADIQPSRLLKVSVGGIYVLAAMILFAASALPLEAKVLLLCFIIRESHRQSSFFTHFNGKLFLNIDGVCRFNGDTFHVERVSFFSRHLIVLDLSSPFEQRRLVLAFDAFQDETFRHISRVCLALKA